MRTYFDGLRAKLLLMTFYDFLTRHLKKRKKSCFLNMKKRKIRILEHWPRKQANRNYPLFMITDFHL